MEGTYFVKTDAGKFRIQKSKGSNMYKGVPHEYSMLKIGGKQNCVEMKWFSDEDTCELQWLDVSDGGCELTGTKVKKEGTVFLLHLAITLLQQYQDIKTLYFLDNSKLHCSLSLHGSSYIEKMSMQRFYFLRHQKTWYEAKFGAYPQHPEERDGYQQMKGNFQAPIHNQFFDFKNKDLNEQFMPLYETSDTWGTFFEKIKQEDCSKFAPWYMSAFGIIASKYKMPEYWQIDINTMPTIPYTITQNGGGTRKNRKERKRKEGIFFSNDMDVNTLRPSELYEVYYK